MTTLSLNNYFTKTQLSERHGRHPRTLGKDITTAVARRDKELLALLRLQVMPGGLVLDGPQVTTAKVKQLKAKHTLTWFARDEFVELVRRKKPQQRRGESPAPQEPQGAAGGRPQTAVPQESSAAVGEVEHIIAALPADSGEKARILEQLYRQASTELVQARAISADFKAVFGDFKEVVNKQADGQQQNNKLMNDLIQEVRQRGLVGSGPAAGDGERSTPQERKVVEAVTVADQTTTSSAAKRAKRKAVTKLAQDSGEDSSVTEPRSGAWQANSVVSRWLPTLAQRIDRFSAPKR